MKKALLALALPAIFAACTPSDNNSQIPHKPGTEKGSETSNTKTATTIKVMNADGQALANTQVLIGTDVDVPFAGNLLTTDANGEALIPEAWTDAAPVTAQSAGYIRVTYLNQTPGAMEFRLRPNPAKNNLQIKGQLTNALPIKNNDDVIDFALIMPAFTKLDILSFDMSTVISKEVDKISAIGQEISVPSNISLPKQQERYALFNITFDKPIYRAFFKNTGANRVYALQGKFPFKSTVDAFRGGKDFLDVINDFTITNGGIRDVNLKDTANPVSLNLSSAEMAFNKARNAVAPRFAADEVYLAVSVANQAGYMIPTDFKRLEVNQKLPLRVLAGSENLLLGLIKKKTDDGSDRMSAALVGFANETSPRMLGLIEKPRLASGVLVVPQVSTVSGINPIATYAILSKETVQTRGDKQVTVRTPLWEVYATEWVSEVALPKWSQNTLPGGTKRWDVNVIGSQTSSQAPAGPAMLDAATHVTHSAISF